MIRCTVSRRSATWSARRRLSSSKAPRPIARSANCSTTRAKSAARVDMTFVPYPGNAPALNAVLGQQVTSMFATLSNVSEYLKVGQLRALAIGNRERARPLRDVPTVAESGYGDFNIDAWFGAFAPAATPEPAINEVEHLFTAALQDSTVKEKLSAQDLFPTVACGSDFAAYLRKQNDAYSRIIAEANIKAE